MAFTVQDYNDFVKLLAAHPEWRPELRRLVLADELLDLPRAVQALTEAQRHTDAQLAQLTEAQRHTDAQLAQLTEAQQRTEARLEQLTARVDALAEAQGRTERALERLSRQVGGLSETIGGDIEDVAATVLCETLRRELGWEVEELERTWVTWDDEEQEIDALGQARDPARPRQKIWILAEVKHNLTLKEVERFARVAALARANLEGEVFPVCFAYRARPAVQARLRELGLRLAFSYGRLM